MLGSFEGPVERVLRFQFDEAELATVQLADCAPVVLPPQPHNLGLYALRNTTNGDKEENPFDL